MLGVRRAQEAGAAMAELCRRHAISEQRFDRRKATSGGMGRSETQRLQGLHDANRRLMKLLAESMLDNAALRDLLADKRDRPRRQRWLADPRGRSPPCRRCASGLASR